MPKFFAKQCDIGGCIERYPLVLCLHLDGPVLFTAEKASHHTGATRDL